MSATLAITLIDTAATRVADPGYRDIKLDQWIGVLNEVTREVGIDLRLVKRRTLFSLEANNAIYTYPDNMVQLVSLEYNPTPNTPTTWRKVDEMFRDEFERTVSMSYPTHEPTHYYADTPYLHLVGMPLSDLEFGCRTTYWGLPDVVVNATTEYLPLPDSSFNMILEGMLERGYVMLEKYDRADRHKATYEQMIAKAGLKVGDRSDDRRQSIRPRSLQRGYGGQT